MEPSLLHGNFIIVNKLQYRLQEPKYYDIVAFPFNDADGTKNYVKRIIGMPGDNIDIQNNKLYINNIEYFDNFSDGDFLERDLPMPATVPTDYYFVLGDNRNHSHDSRYLEVSFIKKQDFIGRVRIRIWPLNSFGSIN